MVAWDVIDFYSMRQHACDFFHNGHVFFGKILFGELPDINDIAVENEFFWSNTFEVANKFRGMTAVGSKMHVRNDERFNFSSLVVSHGCDSQFSILNSEFSRCKGGCFIEDASLIEFEQSVRVQRFRGLVFNSSSYWL